MKIREFVIFSCLILGTLVGCLRKPTMNQHVGTLTNKPAAKELNSNLIPESLFLENRVENCDSAIVFMRAIISPGGLKELPYHGYRIKGESLDFLNKVRETESAQFANNIRFYISTDCLVGQDIQTVLDIFILPEFHQRIWTDIILLEQEPNATILFIFGSFTIIVENRTIKKAGFVSVAMIH